MNKINQIAAEAAWEIFNATGKDYANIKSIIEAAIKKAREQDDHEFIQCPSCGWHPVRKE